MTGKVNKSLTRKRRTVLQRQCADTISARPPTISVVVHSAYTEGTTDRVDRVLDPILAMRRAGRLGNGIVADERYDAAERYRAVYDAVNSGVRSVDLNAAGGGFGARTPSTWMLDAALHLREATTALNAVPVPYGGQVHVTTVVDMVVGQGWTIDSAARFIHYTGSDGRASGRHRKLVSDMLKAGLDALANLWLKSAPRRGGNRVCVR